VILIWLREIKIEFRRLLEAARIGLSVYGKNGLDEIVSGENLKRFCFKNEEIKEDGVSAELASRSGNVVTFQHCNVNVNNFNV
jgi:hypothetical protein